MATDVRRSNSPKAVDVVLSLKRVRPPNQPQHQKGKSKVQASLKTHDCSMIAVFPQTLILLPLQLHPAFPVAFFRAKLQLRRALPPVVPRAVVRAVATWEAATPRTAIAEPHFPPRAAPGDGWVKGLRRAPLLTAHEEDVEHLRRTLERRLLCFWYPEEH